MKPIGCGHGWGRLESQMKKGDRHPRTAGEPVPGSWTKKGADARLKADTGPRGGNQDLSRIGTSETCGKSRLMALIESSSTPDA